MRCISLLAGALALTATSTLQAQDLLRSTGVATRSYNYVEIQYLVDMEASPPLLATLVMDITDSLSFRGEYLNQSFNISDPESGLAFDADAEALSVGVLYHQRLDAMENTDWVAGFMVGRAEVEGRFLGISAKETNNFQEAYLGIRRTLSSELEFEVGANFYRGDDGDIDPTADVKLVLRIQPSIDIALAGNEIGEADILGIGLRYTW